MVFNINQQQNGPPLFLNHNNTVSIADLPVSGVIGECHAWISLNKGEKTDCLAEVEVFANID